MALRFLSIASLAVPGIFAQLLTFPESTTCTANTMCPGLATAGYQFETSQHALPNAPFYTAPSNFSKDLAPGSVLAVEVGTDLSNHTVPSGLTMSRIIYTTTNLNGTVLPASAYILWPANGPSTSSGCSNTSSFSMVAWAHGTSGLFPACASSNYKALQYHFMVPFALALQGIVVVAPDYAGLGVGHLPTGETIPHEYGAPPAQANDLANAVIAARSAFPNYLSTSTPFVAAGHSQGGGIAWAFAERQAAQPVLGYKGTVTFAPPVNFIAQIAQANEDFVNGVMHPWTIPSLGFIQHSVIAGVTAVYPSFNYTGMTAKVYDRFHNVLAKIQGCLPTDNLVFSDVAHEELGVRGWTNTSTVVEFSKRIAVSGKKVAGPLLVLAGELDSAIPIATVAAGVDDTCAVNDGTADIEFVTYKDMDHFPLIQASQAYWMQWVKDQLLGNASPSKRATGGCTKRTVESFRKEFNKQWITPNWLVTGISTPQEIWKYTL